MPAASRLSLLCAWCLAGAFHRHATAVFDKAPVLGSISSPECNTLLSPACQRNGPGSTYARQHTVWHTLCCHPEHGCANCCPLPLELNAMCPAGFGQPDICALDAMRIKRLQRCRMVHASLDYTPFSNSEQAPVRLHFLPFFHVFFQCKPLAKEMEHVIGWGFEKSSLVWPAHAVLGKLLGQIYDHVLIDGHCTMPWWCQTALQHFKTVHTYS